MLVLLVIGFGSTNVIFAATVAASTGVPNEKQVAGGLVNTTRQVGAALGVAALLSVAQAGDGARASLPPAATG